MFEKQQHRQQRCRRRRQKAILTFTLQSNKEHLYRNNKFKSKTHLILYINQQLRITDIRREQQIAEYEPEETATVSEEMITTDRTSAAASASR